MSLSHTGAQEGPTLYHNTNLHALEIDGLVLPGCVELARALLDGLRSTQLKKLAISMLVLRNNVLASFDWGQLDALELLNVGFALVPGGGDGDGCVAQVYFRILVAHAKAVSLSDSNLQQPVGNHWQHYQYHIQVIRFAAIGAYRRHDHER